MTLGLNNVSTFASEKNITQIYVSTSGSDSNPGTQDKPLRTAIGARDRIRELKKSGTLGADGATVYFREGIYQFTESFELGAEDSGKEGAPITYRAYADEEVQFIGGINISPDSFQLVTDQLILNRLVSDNAKNSLYRTNLKALGIKEIPVPYLLGQYSYWQVEGVAQEKSVIMGDLVEALGYKSDSAKSPELFIDGEIMPVAKYPNDGFLTVDVVTEAGPFMRNWNDDIMGSQNWVPPEERVPTPFRFINKNVQNRLEKWQTADQAIMWGKWYWDWATQSGNGNVNKSAVGDNPSFCVNLKLDSKMII